MEENGNELLKQHLASAVGKAIAEQEHFEQQRATMFGRGAERLSAPVAGLFGKLIPPRLLTRALDAADGMAGKVASRELSDHSYDDLPACEVAALRVQAWATGSSALSGGLGGVFGAAGLAADVPATLLISAHTVRATGFAYGFSADDTGERRFRLMVLQLATSLASKNRAENVQIIKQMANQLATPEGLAVLDVASEWVIEKVVDRIARQMGISLGSRKIGQVVPVVGGIVAAAVNASFQTDIARSARFAYRERWLQGRKLLARPDEGTWE